MTIWIILAISIGLLSWQKVFSFILVAIAIAIALYENLLTPISLSILAVILCVMFLHQYYNAKKVILVLTEVILVAMAILLFFHYLPGFNNPKILNKVIAGASSAPFTMYFNLDKALIPFVLLFALPTLLRANSSSKHSSWQWMLLIISIPVLLLIATFAGGLRIEPHFPEWIWKFVLANLFFVSFAEEALFRGYIQQRFSNWLGHIPALFISAALFGLAHFPGGYLLVVFAFLAGIIYGIAWMWSGKLWVSTLFHFGLNLIHLLFFTYPSYRPYFI